MTTNELDQTTGNQSTLEELIAVLEKESSCYQNLADLAEQARCAISARDTEALGGIVELQAYVASLASDLGRRRTTIVGCLHSGANIDEIAAGAEPSVAAKLSKLRDNLVKVVEAIRERQQRNEALLHAMISHIGMNVQHILRSRVLYASDGQSRSLSSSLVLDRLA